MEAKLKEFSDEDILLTFLVLKDAECTRDAFEIGFFEKENVVADSEFLKMIRSQTPEVKLP